MPEPHRPSDRTPAQRQADHAGLARLSETLLPSLVHKLNGSALGELEVREGDWKIRLRRPVGAAAHARRDRTRPGSQGPARQPRDGATGKAPDADRAAVTSPAVGVFRAVAAVGAQVRVGDRIGVVDLLGIPQDVVSPIDGVLVDVLVESGDAVEYGEEVAAVQAPVPEPSPVPAPDDATDADDAGREVGE